MLHQKNIFFCSTNSRERSFWGQIIKADFAGPTSAFIINYCGGGRGNIWEYTNFKNYELNDQICTVKLECSITRIFKEIYSNAFSTKMIVRQWRIVPIWCQWRITFYYKVPFISIIVIFILYIFLFRYLFLKSKIIIFFLWIFCWNLRTKMNYITMQVQFECKSTGTPKPKLHLCGYQVTLKYGMNVSSEYAIFFN